MAYGGYGSGTGGANRRRGRYQPDQRTLIIVVIAAAISPYREIRDEIRAKTPGFFEVYVRCPLDELVRRDVKGLYKQAIAGEIANFTGISDPYEEPLTPAVTVDSSELNPVQAVSRILTGLERAGHLEAASTDRLPQGPALKAAIEEAQRLPAIEVGPRELSDLYLLAAGGFAPLSGFVDSDDYHHILDQGRLASGAPFTIPVALRAASAPTADRLTLRLEGQPVGIIEVTEVFSTDPEKEALKVYGTLESAHPGVALLQQEGRYAIAGAVTALATPTAGFPQYERTPAEVRRIKIEGFIVSDHLALWPKALAEIGGLVASGKLKYRETVRQGLDAAPQGLVDLLHGGNFGKMLVKLV